MYLTNSIIKVQDKERDKERKRKMEAYTNITIKMENNEVVKKATERIIGVIRKSELYKSEAKNFEIFINDIKTNSTQ